MLSHSPLGTMIPTYAAGMWWLAATMSRPILGGGENLTLRTLAALSTALDARFDVQLGTLKAEDTYSSRDTADAEVAPAENHHPLTRAKHYENARTSEAYRRR
ncbi:MAG TPA: hypothetical protein VHN16_03210 [Streptosporangiaceae bacterium]|nr:hypothetical protein [Streptosporangiaceae bacterium]